MSRELIDKKDLLESLEDLLYRYVPREAFVRLIREAETVEAAPGVCPSCGFDCRKTPCLAERVGDRVLAAVSNLTEAVTAVEEQLDRESIRIRGHKGAIGQLGSRLAALEADIKGLKEHAERGME